MRSTLPFAWYHDQKILELERDRIFRRRWQYVGHAGRAPEPGSLAACRAGTMPVLLARDEGGTLRAFLNVCRHRGALLVEGERRRSTIQCPYHAWTYGLDGRLRAAPRAEREADFDAGALGLVPLAVDTWGPFVFVSPDAGAEPLADALGELPERVAEVGIDVDRLHFRMRVESGYAANWKICCENFLECYHCPVAHPGFSETIDVSEGAYRLEADGLVSSQYGPVREEPGASFDPSGPVSHGQFHFVFPNLTINIAPGRTNLSIGSVLPNGPGRTTRFLDYFFGPDAGEAWIRAMLAWDDRVGEEDRILVERVQRGVEAGAPAAGVLLGSERLVERFDRLVVDALDG